MISDCENLIRNSSQILNVDLGRSPFIFSSSHNKFVVEGCGEAAIAISLDYRPPTGCSTICRNNTLRDKNKCLGLGCCQITIPYYFKSYMIYVIVLERQGRDGVCGSAFLVDENSYDEGRFSGDNSYVPISLLWTLSASELEITTNDTLVTRIVVDLADGNSITSWKCYFSEEFEGNPYLVDGRACM